MQQKRLANGEMTNKSIRDDESFGGGSSTKKRGVSNSKINMSFDSSSKNFRF